jgi:hypothetical protein
MWQHHLVLGCRHTVYVALLHVIQWPDTMDSTSHACLLQIPLDGTGSGTGTVTVGV